MQFRRQQFITIRKNIYHNMESSFYNYDIVCYVILNKIGSNEALNNLILTYASFISCMTRGKKYFSIK